MFKRLLCNHSWKCVNTLIFNKSTYGCTKCGKTKKLYCYDYNEWKFIREAKGETFE